MLVLGLAYAAWLFPLQSLWPDAPLHMPLIGDEAVSAIGQRYFLAAPWGWPPLDAPRLAAPGGTNIALTDSIPLAMLLLKPFRSVLPAGFFLGAGWVALVWALQPVAAIYALRGAGERRATPSLAIAVLSVSMPTLLARYGHTALCTPCGDPCGPRRLPATDCGAVPLDVGLRHPASCGMPANPSVHPGDGRRGARRYAAEPAGAGEPALANRRALVCGDLRGAWDGSVRTRLRRHAACGRVGFYSMNLLGPLLPSHTDLWPTLAINATGGQAGEGFQYLGAGLIALLALVAVPAVSGPARLACTAACRAGAGLGGDGDLLAVQQGFCGTVAGAGSRGGAGYSAAVPRDGSVLLAGRLHRHAGGRAARHPCLSPRAAAAVLALAAALQVADTAQLRASIQSHTAAAVPWSLDEPSLAPIFAAHDRMTLWPSFGCDAASTDVETMQAMLIASQTTLRTNTMFSARTRGEPDCDPAPVLSQPLRPGELRVIQRPGEAWRVPGAAQACRRSGSGSV